MTTHHAIQLRPQDNVAVVVQPVTAGDTVIAGDRTITARQPIPAGHKIAVAAVKKGAAIIKYAVAIGAAMEHIAPGDHVHVHNTAPATTDGKYEFSTAVPIVDYLPPADIPTFQGYLRKDGRVGTRNYIALISTVNCSATVTNAIAERCNASLIKDYPNVDGVAPFTHYSGCAPKPGVAGYDDLTKVLAGIAQNPNVGDYCIISLGCEGTHPTSLIADRGLIQIGRPKNRPRVITLQESGGVQKTIEAGVRAVAEMLPRVNDIRRTPQPLSKLMLATECGGSDALSGITANPAVGAAADYVVRCGGTAILSETTEMYGAEHALLKRAVSKEVGQKLLDKFAWWQKYLGFYGMQCNNNPSKGNIEGGLTNIVEKSLGAVMKGGTMPLVDVYDYADLINAKGFVIMDTPGYDPPSVTGMVAGGATLVLFTTGRGSCFGFKPSPVIKIATNSEMYHRMEGDMDINAGEIIDGVSVQEMGMRIVDEIIAVASGKQSKSEINGMGAAEFVPWVRGATV